MKKSSKILFYILVVVTFLVITIILARKSLQNDTFYTIKVGESIVKNGVDMKDHFSWIPDLVYTYPHWLYDVCIYGLYSLGGFNLLYISTITLGFTLLLLMFLLSSKITKNMPVAYLFTIAFSLCLHGFFAVRAQMVSYILLLLILYSIEMLRESKKKRYYVYIFISSLLIANMHLAVYPFIFALFLPFIVQDLVYFINKKFNLKLTNKFNFEIEHEHLKEVLIAFCLCLLTGFLTPNFLVPFTYLINTFNGVSLSHISEHSPITINERPEVFILLLVVAFLILNKKNKIKLRDFFLLAGLFFMGFKSTRSIALLIVLSIIAVVRMIPNADILYRVVFHKLFTILLILFFVGVGIYIVRDRQDVVYVNKSDYPIKACDFIKENLDYNNIHLYNGYNYGSYLIYRDIPVFIDSRADLYLKEFNSNCTVFEDYFDTPYNYKYYFNKYSIEYVLVENGTTVDSKIRKDKGFKPIYEDEDFTIYHFLTS